MQLSGLNFTAAGVGWIDICTDDSVSGWQYRYAERDVGTYQNAIYYSFTVSYNNDEGSNVTLFTDLVWLEFRIVPTEADISIVWNVDPEFEYTGQAVEPVPGVDFDVYIDGQDDPLDPGYYHVEYSDNVEPGTAGVTVTLIPGDGQNYSGTADSEFTIVQDIVGITATVEYDKVYQGQVLTDVVTVTVTVEYENDDKVDLSADDYIVTGDSLKDGVIVSGGSVDLTFGYEGFTVTVTVDVIPAISMEISGSFETVYDVQDLKTNGIDTTGMVITVTYANEGTEEQHDHATAVFYDDGNGFAFVSQAIADDSGSTIASPGSLTSGFSDEFGYFTDPVTDKSYGEVTATIWFIDPVYDVYDTFQVTVDGAVAYYVYVDPETGEYVYYAMQTGTAGTTASVYGMAAHFVPDGYAFTGIWELFANDLQDPEVEAIDWDTGLWYAYGETYEFDGDENIWKNGIVTFVTYLVEIPDTTLADVIDAAINGDLGTTDSGNDYVFNGGYIYDDEIVAFLYDESYYYAIIDYIDSGADSISGTPVADLMNDFARFMGSVYRSSDVTVDSVTFDGITYTWQPNYGDKELKGSNWRAEDGTTLVSAVVDYVKDNADLFADFYGGIEITLTVGDNEYAFTYGVVVMQPEPEEEATVTQIIVDAQTEYDIGDAFSAVVYAIYSDGSVVELAEGEYDVTGFDSGIAGAKSVIVSYEGVSSTVIVNVNAPEPEPEPETPYIVGIDVEPAADATYTVGDTLDATVSVVYSDGSTSPVEDCELPVLTAVGTYYVQVSYGEYTAYVQVTVNAAVSETQEYAVYVDGVSVGTYAEGATVEVEGEASDGYEFIGWTVNDVIYTDVYTVSGADASEDGAIYLESYEVEISAGGDEPETPAVTQIIVDAQTEYVIGDDFSATVYAILSDGSVVVLTADDYTVTDFDNETSGFQTVTVSYEGVTETVTVIVSEPETPEGPTYATSVISGVYYDENTHSTVTILLGTTEIGSTIPEGTVTVSGYYTVMEEDPLFGTMAPATYSFTKTVPISEGTTAYTLSVDDEGCEFISGIISISVTYTSADGNVSASSNTFSYTFVAASTED